MVRKLFMLMAGFCTDPVHENYDLCSINKTVNMESVGSGMYIHIGTMERGKGTVFYHRVEVKRKRHP